MGELQRVAAYYRVSTDDQREKDTIENQVEFISKYCDLHELGKPLDYRDDGVTGTLPLEERPAGKRLMEDARAGKFDLLLIYRLDRLGRSARIVLNAVHDLEKLGIKIKSATEPFDTGDPAGRFLLTMLAGVADLERSSILERMAIGANRAARLGRWLGGITPYGYRVTPEKYLEINEDKLPGLEQSEADIIRLIYRLTVDDHYSCVQIADYLNGLGIPPAYVKDERKILKGKRKENTSGIWRPSRIRNMLVNPTYKGVHFYGRRTVKKREIIPRQMPAIVTLEIWDRAQEILHEHQLKGLMHKKRDYLLSGIIKCGNCGLTYIGTAFKNNSSKGGVIPYYLCNGKQSYKGPLERCKSKNIPSDWIDQLIWGECLDFINHAEETIKIIMESGQKNKIKVRDVTDEKNQILKAIESKGNEKQIILDLYRKQVINSADIEEQLIKITIETASLEQRIRELDYIAAANEIPEDYYKSIESRLAEFKEAIKGEIPFNIKREIVKAFVEKIVVISSENNGKLEANIDIYYRFSQVDTHTVNRAENELGEIKRSRKVPGKVRVN